MEEIAVVTVIKDLSESFGSKVHTLVGHLRPDEDVLAGFWIAESFGLCIPTPLLRFVRSGESLPGSENDPRVLHVDTGGGEFDTHGKGLGRTCSVALLAARLGVQDRPGIADLLEWVTKIDCAEPLSATDQHYYLLRVPQLEAVKNRTGGVDWLKAKERFYEVFENIYLRGVRRQRAKEDFPKYSRWFNTPTGTKVCSILGHGELREEAYRQGADVIVWTQKANGSSHVGVSINTSEERGTRIELRRALNLRAAVALLRWKEGQKRGLDLDVSKLGYWGQAEPVPGWFFHDSDNLILSGSGTHPLRPEEFTKLTGEEIVQIVIASLD